MKMSSLQVANSYILIGHHQINLRSLMLILKLIFSRNIQVIKYFYVVSSSKWMSMCRQQPKSQLFCRKLGPYGFYGQLISNVSVTLFRFKTIFCGTDNIPQNILAQFPHLAFQSPHTIIHWTNILLYNMLHFYPVHHSATWALKI